MQWRITIARNFSSIRPSKATFLDSSRIEIKTKTCTVNSHPPSSFFCPYKYHFFIEYIIRNISLWSLQHFIKVPKFPLISWCGNFVERHSFGNCTFPQNFDNRKLGEISVFYAVVKLNLTYCLFSLSFVILCRSIVFFFKSFWSNKTNELFFIIRNLLLACY